ncbi:MAG: metallophosphoesterase, partial [bacterium]|nr:metallophosphoesterase [bacterium]
RVKDNEKGTVYVVSVSGPKFYNVKKPHKELMAKIETDRQLFQVIYIDYDRLHYEAFDAKGDVCDSFVLEKRLSEHKEGRI